MSDEESQRAITGPATITVAIHPEPPHPLCSFMVIDDDEEGEIAIALGGADDITQLIATLIRTQNMLNESDELIEERGADTIEDRTEVVSYVAAKYYLGEDD